MHVTISERRRRLGIRVFVLGVLVACAAAAFFFIEAPISKWLIFSGAALGSVPQFFTVVRMSRDLGRAQLEDDNRDASPETTD